MKRGREHKFEQQIQPMCQSGANKDWETRESRKQEKQKAGGLDSSSDLNFGILRPPDSGPRSVEGGPVDSGGRIHRSAAAAAAAARAIRRELWGEGFGLVWFIYFYFLGGLVLSSHFSCHWAPRGLDLFELKKKDKLTNLPFNFFTL